MSKNHGSVIKMTLLVCLALVNRNHSHLHITNRSGSNIITSSSAPTCACIAIITYMCEGEPGDKVQRSSLTNDYMCMWRGVEGSLGMRLIT